MKSLVARYFTIRINPLWIVEKYERPAPPRFLITPRHACGKMPFWLNNCRLLMLVQCHQRLIDGKDFRDAPILVDWKRKLEAGQTTISNGVEINQPGDADALVEAYLKLFQSMAEQGYDESIAQPSIGAAIDENGALVKATNGRHRLGIAQYTRVSAVPVVIKHVHIHFLKRELGSAWLVRLYRIPAILSRLEAVYSREPPDHWVRNLAEQMTAS